jgi:hypothetical protein
MAFVVICSWAADLLAESHSRRKAFALGLLCAMFVSIFMAGHVLFWDAIGCQDLTCIVTRSKEGFSRAFANGWLALYVKYNLTDFIVYFVSAFFAASIFVGPVRSARIQQDAAIDPGAEVEGVGKGVKKNSPSLATAVCFAFLGPLLLLINPSRVEADPVAAARKAQFGRTVVVGFRSDAEPFSYRAGTGGTKTYRGFIVDLCHDVFEGSIYSVEQVEISAADRYENLRRGKFLLNDLSKLDRSRIDILCEPTTLRFDREVERANGIFSPIIFVSGVSYLMRPTRELNPQTYLAYVAGTTAANVARLACKNDLFSLRDEDGTTLEDCVAENWRSYDPLTGSSKAVAGCPAVASPGIQRGGQQYRICAFSSHDKLIEWFCQGPTAPLQSRLVYFGDREIIRAKLESWKARERCPTQGIEEQQAYYTYEPYALLMSRADPCLVQFVQRRIYEFFSHRSKANSLFATYFPDAQMSPVVASLFLLNAVDEERRFRVPDLGEDPPDAVKLEAALDERVSGAECYRKVDP